MGSEIFFKLYDQEEFYWLQRGNVHRLKVRDAIAAYFHVVANGRKRKCAIFLFGRG
jgi:hypothetical protein